MSLRKKVASTLGVGALVLGSLFMTPAAAHATGDPGHLDKGDLTIQRKRQNGQLGWTAVLQGSTAYSWKCVYGLGGKNPTGIDINSYCMYLAGVWAAAPNPNDPYSWHCQGY